MSPRLTTRARRPDSAGARRFPSRAVVSALIVLVALLVAWIASTLDGGSGPGRQPPADGRGAGLAVRGVPAVGEIALAELPRQARDTLALIQAGGPYPYEKDGTVFGNREGVLPRRARGYYTEYTVRTPGARNRGARRIIAGGDGGRPVEFFYTDDHYASFRRIIDASPASAGRGPPGAGRASSRDGRDTAPVATGGAVP